MDAIIGRVSVAAPLADALEPLRSEPTRAAVLLDVDGTLAPIVRHADDAHVPEPTRVPLIAIAKRYGLVACVSGRQASIARRIVSLGTITYVGNHGAEILRGGATEAELDPEVAAWAPRVQDFARSAMTDELRRLRVRDEDKQVIAALHWRGAPDEAAAERAVMAVKAQAEAAGFWTHEGRKVLEIRPPVALDKGRGIRRLLAGRQQVDTALYAGDDLTDLDAFSVLRELRDEGVLTSALCVGVASDETPPRLAESADMLVDGPAGVRAMLSMLAA
ncbi:MAG: trehalose-phosphatase [Actinobacteria bacterium]|nr:MAG: trehalose-phosphatase [Actinomycetota bacterium]